MTILCKKQSDASISGFRAPLVGVRPAPQQRDAACALPHPDGCGMGFYISVEGLPVLIGPENGEHERVSLASIDGRRDAAGLKTRGRSRFERVVAAGSSAIGASASALRSISADALSARAPGKSLVLLQPSIEIASLCGLGRTRVPRCLPTRRAAGVPGPGASKVLVPRNGDGAADHPLTATAKSNSRRDCLVLAMDRLGS